MSDVNDLRRYRTQALDEAKKILDTAEHEDRNVTDEERGKYDELMKKAAEYKEREQRLLDLEEQEAACPENPVGESAKVGMTPKETRQYSLVRAIRAAASGDWSNAGLELEASRAEEERRDTPPRSFYVPADVLETRDVTVGTGTGDQLVATDLLAGSYIDLLRNKMMVRAAGARIMSGLVGDVAIPKASSGATAYWVAEDGEPTESTPAWTQVTLSPKFVGTYVDISRKTLQQATPDVEMLVRDDLAAKLALAIDYAALHGSGSSNQPTGIASTSGIGSVVGGTDGANPDWADIIDLETAVAIDNADIGALAYMTNAAVRGYLKQAVRVSSTDSRFIWGEGQYPLNGYPVHVTNQVASDLDKGTSTGVCSAIFFGNWNDLLIGMWGGLDILVNPYTLSTTSQVRVVAFQTIDIAVRYAQSFAAMLDALTS